MTTSSLPEIKQRSTESLDSNPSEVLSETFPERKLPRDLIDCLIGIFIVGPWVGILFFTLPALLASGFLIEAGVRDYVAGWGGTLIGLAVLIDVALLVHLPAFRSVTTDRDGLLFRRYAGPSKRVMWSALIRISEAPRSEIVQRVWLWPGFPPRGSLLCASAKGQYRIEWNGGNYYFALKDVNGFLDAVGRHRPDLIAGVHSD